MFARLYNKVRTPVPIPPPVPTPPPASVPPPVSIPPQVPVPPMEQPVKPLRDNKRLRERLYKLDRSSIQFPEQLDELLQDHEWVEGAKSLPEDELVELIDYLDDVSFISMLTKLCSPTP